MILHILRAAFLVIVLALTITFATQQTVLNQGPTLVTLYILLPAVIACAIILIDMFWRQKRLNVLGGLFFGVVAGLAVAFVLTPVIDLLGELIPAPPVVSYTERPTPPAVERPVISADSSPQEKEADAEWQQYTSDLEDYESRRGAHLRHQQGIELAKMLLRAAAVFFCVTIVMQTKDEFRFIIPYVEFSKQTKGAQPMILDTSVIIDGRIADILDTRILQGELIVPRFVLAELQTVADSQDKLKRNRGRRGLDVLQKLQAHELAEINILEVHVPAVVNAIDVDSKLVALAEHLNARVMTNDYNLNKVSQLRGVDVVNLNDLANALKPIVLPGETLTVRVLRPGEEPGQGVGYLDDGTMVVADGGRDSIGKTITITVTSVLQTSAGRMIFGRFDSAGKSADASAGESSVAQNGAKPAGDQDNARPRYSRNPRRRDRNS